MYSTDCVQRAGIIGANNQTLIYKSNSRTTRIGFDEEILAFPVIYE